jgi:mono/diheme cytochrome c family protein
MTRSIQRCAIALLIILFVVGCTKDEGPLFVPVPPNPEQPVDSAFFSTEVLPIFTAHCWTCHPPNGGLDLSADMAYSDLVGMESIYHPPGIRVVPGAPESSVLWHKINFTQVYGLGMPPDGNVLSLEQIATITAWIEQGAHNN